MPRKFSDLADDERAEVLRHYRSAIALRIRQWNAEAEIEAILGREVPDFKIPDFAAGAHDEDASELTLEDIAPILNDE